MPPGLYSCETYTIVDEIWKRQVLHSSLKKIIDVGTNSHHKILRNKTASLISLNSKYNLITVTKIKKSYCINNASNLDPISDINIKSKTGTVASY